ncbi:MAG: VanZ family protein [Acidobacteriota bacterium]|nr:MAG: VanZ family protein [Acidobacteriota bacterium]
MSARRWILLWSPVGIYVACIFYLSSLPNPFEITGVPPAPAWALHIVEYAGLSFLWIRAVTSGLARPPRFVEAAIVVAAAGAIGAADEVWQSFHPGRWATAWDALADTVGAFVGVAAFAGLVRALRGRRAAHSPIRS